jgi:hypothetical protein
MKMGGRQPLFDNSGTRPFNDIQFSKIGETYRRHPYDENGRLAYFTSKFYSRGKELNATTFVISSYNGGRLGRAILYRYVYDNMEVINFVKASLKKVDSACGVGCRRWR